MLAITGTVPRDFLSSSQEQKRTENPVKYLR